MDDLYYRTGIQVIRHGGRVEAAVTAETTQLVVLPQLEAAAVAPDVLLKAVARGGDGAAAVRHVHSRLEHGQLHLVTSKCAADHDMMQAVLDLQNCA